MAGDRYDFIDKVRGQINDEEEAGPMYASMAELASSLGMHSEASILMEISADEYKHHRLLTSMLGRLQEGEPVSRPFPKTYEDWANLGFDIKVKDPNADRDVDSNLASIYYGYTDQDYAKRWLVRKAGELGIT